MEQKKLEEAKEIFAGATEEIPEIKKVKDAFRTAIECIEKQIPKKPINKDRLKYCPACDSWLCWDIANYCIHCGQILEW